MFTDEPTTPTRVETLIDLLRQSHANRRFTRSVLYGALQPVALSGVRSEGSSTQAQHTIRAAAELGLIREAEDGGIGLTFERSDRRSTSEIVVDALDERILGNVEIEPYFAPFYSYLLYLNHKGAAAQKGRDWAIAFERDVYGGERGDRNPFNEPKYTGLNRW
jgi:hypothetical protein